MPAARSSKGVLWRQRMLAAQVFWRFGWCACDLQQSGPVPAMQISRLGASFASSPCAAHSRADCLPLPEFGVESVRLCCYPVPRASIRSFNHLVLVPLIQPVPSKPHTNPHISSRGSESESSRLAASSPPLLPPLPFLVSRQPLRQNLSPQLCTPPYTFTTRVPATALGLADSNSVACSMQPPC